MNEVRLAELEHVCAEHGAMLEMPRGWVCLPCATSGRKPVLVGHIDPAPALPVESVLGAIRERKEMPSWRRAALDAQDASLGLGRYELVQCRDGKMRPKWLLQRIAAEHGAKEMLRDGYMHQGRWSK